MIKFYCDICGAEKKVEDIFGVGGSKNGMYLVHSGNDFPGITEYKYHICKDCLAKIGWKDEDWQEVKK